MGTARIELVGVNVIQAEPKARVELVSVNVLFSETATWEAFITGSASVEGTLTVEEAATPSLVGTCAWDIREGQVWSTEVIKGGDGSPQRMARRTIPLDLLRIPIVLRTPEESARWANVVHAWSKNLWQVPLWYESTRHAGPLSAGASSIAIDTAYADYRAGGLALVWDSADTAETVAIDSVAADALTLTGTLASDHGPAWIMPVRTGYLLDAVTRERLAGGGSLVEMAFSIDDLAAVTGHTAALTCDSMDVLTDPALLEGTFHEQIDPDVIRLQTSTGRLGVVAVTKFPIATQSHGWYPTTPAACWSLRQFLHAHYGGQKPFLVPTFQPDLVLTRPAGASDTTLYVANRSYVRMGLNDLRTYLAFRPAGATIIPRKVTGFAAVSATEEQVEIDSAPGVAFAAGASLCWLDRCILPDQVDLTWYGRGKATCEVQLERVSQ